MASRVCARLLLNTTLKRERCLVSAVSRMSVRPYSITTRSFSLLQTPSYGLTRLHYCTTPKQDEIQPKEPSSFVVRLQGLPWAVTKEDIEKFLQKGDIEAAEINFTYYMNRRFTGVAYLVLKSQADMEAVLEMDGEHIGERYVQILPSNEDDLKSRQDPSCSSIVRIGGLPFRASREDIKEFFSGLDIVPNGVRIILNRESRPAGIAYVVFSTPEMAERALEKDGKTLGERYVNIKKWTSIPPGGINRRSTKIFEK